MPQGSVPVSSSPWGWGWWSTWCGVGAVAEWGGRKAQAYTREVLATYGTICRLCGLDGADTADHIVARSKGGDPYDIANGRPAHLSCNSSRGNRDVTVEIETGLDFFKVAAA